jgi:hypothetical protein
MPAIVPVHNIPARWIVPAACLSAGIELPCVTANKIPISAIEALVNQRLSVGACSSVERWCDWTTVCAGCAVN